MTTPSPPERTVGDQEVVDTTPEARKRRLSDLLRDLFSEAELRRFADGLPLGEELTAALPGGNTSRAELAEQLVAALARRGQIDARLFAALLGERPAQRERIAGAASAWSVPLAASEPPRAANAPAPARRWTLGVMAIALLLIVGVALALLLRPPRPCFADQDGVPGIELAREACAAYLDTIHAFNERDQVAYEAGFAEPMDCFYNLPNSSVRARQTGMQGTLDVDANSVSFLRLEGDARVVLCDLGIYDSGDGRGRRPHNKVIVMQQQYDRWKITVETTRGATACYRSPC